MIFTSKMPAAAESTGRRQGAPRARHAAVQGHARQSTVPGGQGLTPIRLQAACAVIAELLKSIGYATKQFGKDHQFGDLDQPTCDRLRGMIDTSEPAPPMPFTRTRAFWVLIAYAIGLGVLGAFAGLVFIGVTGVGERWYTDSNPGWFGGQWWWVAVTTAAGVGVGLLRHLTHLPEQTPGLIADLEEQHVDARLVPGIVAVSAVSLIGGASLGPEKALGSIGGGAGSWFSERRRLDTEDSQVATLAGFAGAYGGLFSSTVIVVMMILEITRPGGQRLARTLVSAIVASSISFGIYFAIAGSVFLDIYQVPAVRVRGLAAAGRRSAGPVRGCAGDTSGRDCQSGGAALQSARGPEHRAINTWRPGVRACRCSPPIDAVHR